MNEENMRILVMGGSKLKRKGWKEFPHSSNGWRRKLQ